MLTSANLSYSVIVGSKVMLECQVLTKIYINGTYKITRESDFLSNLFTPISVTNKRHIVRKIICIIKTIRLTILESLLYFGKKVPESSLLESSLFARMERLRKTK